VDLVGDGEEAEVEVVGGVRGLVEGLSVTYHRGRDPAGCLVEARAGGYLVPHGGLGGTGLGQCLTTRTTGTHWHIRTRTPTSQQRGDM